MIKLIFRFKKIVFFFKINIFYLNLTTTKKFSLAIIMDDYIIKTRFKGILVISIKKSDETMKRVTNFKDWIKFKVLVIFIIRGLIMYLTHLFLTV